MNRKVFPLILFLSLILLLALRTPVFPQSQFNLNPCEKWIIQQIAKGDVADLTERFDKEEDRTIKTVFLEMLLTNRLKGLNVHRHGVMIENAVMAEPFVLLYAEIPYAVVLKNCLFKNDVNLMFCHFQKNLVLDNTIFESEVKFNHTRIGAGLAANNTKFNATSKTVFFRNIEVGDTASFKNVLFKGAADFTHAYIGGNFQANNAKFTNEHSTYNFNNMKVNDTTFFKDAVFNGGVEFGNAEIKGNLEAQKARFENINKVASFNLMKVGRSVHFEETTFKGEADFLGMEIKDSFLVSGAEFKNTEKIVNFISLKVGRHTSFNKVVFEGGVDFSLAEINGIFQIIETKFNNKGKIVNFTGMKVDNIALFKMTGFKGPVSMKNCDFSKFILSNVLWPPVQDYIILDGMTYKYIDAGDEKDSWKRLLELADHSVYNTSVYMKLEAFFLQQGNPKRANDVFVARKKRERNQIFKKPWWKVISLVPIWLVDWFLFLSVRYGRSPIWALVWSILIIITGSIVFRKNNMTEKISEKKSFFYHPLWYSVDLFLPFINLQVANIWMPRKQHGPIQHYMRIHRFIGWVLIPVGLMAWTGIIK